jgi:hypothetical protein
LFRAFASVVEATEPVVGENRAVRGGGGSAAVMVTVEIR